MNTYYPYCETFDKYESAMTKEQAEAFVTQRNKCKGGHWVVHTKEEHDQNKKSK